MKTIIFTSLFFVSLLNAQNPLFFSKNKPELNTNVSIDFNYVEKIVNGNMESALFTFNLANASYYQTSGTQSIEQSEGGIKSWKINLTSSSGNISIIPYDATLNGKILRAQMSIYLPSGQTLNSVGVYTRVDGAYTLVKTVTSKDVWVGVEYIMLHGSTPAADRSFHYSISGAIGDSFYVDNISFSEVIYPDSFVGTTMTATDYVIEDNGCKLVEVTGETYIQMSDTLDAGYYKLKVTQDWTQGKLWAYNGTTTYNFPQSDGIYAVKIYLPGNKPLVIGCDNNTISIISSLSIK